MPTLKGSKTEHNLLAAFAGESQARNRYSFAASIARKEGYEQISSIFIETADNEKEHAKVFFKQLQGGEATITAGYPAGLGGDTLAQLKAAAAGEKHEWTTLYTGFADDAAQEGFRARPFSRNPRKLSGSAGIADASSRRWKPRPSARLASIPRPFSNSTQTTIRRVMRHED